MNRLVRAAERFGNTVATPPPYRVGSAAKALHERLLVADLHADTLLASRDLRQAADQGHVDLPRLRAGHVGLQVFSIVTNMPACVGLAHCRRWPNLVALLAGAQGWPIGTWYSDKARALHQAARLRAVAADPAAGIVVLCERADLTRLLAEPLATRRIGVLLAVEGAQAIGDDIAGVDELADAGVRLLGLAHYFDNAAAGSAHGITGGGLSAFGREVLQRAIARGMIIDLAHASPRAIADVLLAAPKAPIVVSHTGLRAVCDNPRNLSDEQVQDIIRAGGLIGIGAWHRALCMPHSAPAAAYVEKMVRTISHAVAMADGIHPGRGHAFVALGSDFDGWVRVGFDASGWAQLTEGLLNAGLREPDIACIMGGNVCSLLLQALPDCSAGNSMML
jgi:microsomal dipeptidase-like Zn-dependent dipeptidase